MENGIGTDNKKRIVIQTDKVEGIICEKVDEDNISLEIRKPGTDKTVILGKDEAEELARFLLQ